MRLHVDVKARRGTFALDAQLDVDLATHPVLVVFGPSGCGKSTLLRVLAGLEDNTTGNIRLGEHAWLAGHASTTPQERRVGMVFQDGALFPHMTGLQNVAFGIRAASAERRRRAMEQLERLGVGELAERRPRDLSGGQAQRVALARALASGPRLLLLDEPMSALDVSSREHVRTELGRHLRASGVPALLVTHDLSDAVALGDALCVMDAGRVLQVGPLAEVLRAPSGERVARIMGTETVVPGDVVGTDGGLSRVRVGGVELLSSTVVQPGGVLAFIRAEDVTLETGPAAHSSARNRLPGVVTDVARPGALCRVTVDVGFMLACVVTPRSVEELGLAPGARVTAVVKASAVHVVQRA